MSDTRTLASPHSLIWHYYECLQRQIRRVPTDEPDRVQKQELALALFLAVSVVETFINAFFRVVVEEDGFRTHRDRVLKDIERRRSLDAKIKKWPENVLGVRLDESTANVKRFLDLKNHRNALMHFVSSHESIELPGPLYVHGMADMSAFQALSLEQAVEYPEIIRRFVFEIFLARGITEERLPHAFHQWFGEPPSNHALQPTAVRNAARRD
jgi:hypothetical protein